MKPNRKSRMSPPLPEDQKQTRLSTIDHELIRTTAEKVDDIVALLRGKGQDNGLMGRVDRLEQKGRANEWWSRSAAGGAIAALVHAVWRAITHT